MNRNLSSNGAAFFPHQLNFHRLLRNILLIVVFWIGGFLGQSNRVYAEECPPHPQKSPQGFQSPQCTWWVDILAAEDGWNLVFSEDDGRDAWRWWDLLENGDKSQTPSVGSIMVLDSQEQWEVGHLAYVTAVSGDTITINHSNVDYLDPEGSRCPRIDSATIIQGSPTQVRIAGGTARNLRGFLSVPDDGSSEGSLVDESPIFSLDLRGDIEGVQISGRVLDANTRQRISGAEVTIAGQTRTTESDGGYDFSSIGLDESERLTVTKSGYLEDWLYLPEPESRRSMDVRDVLLTPQGVTSAPLIASASLSVDGHFIEHWAQEVAAIVRVNWNGNDPGEVRFMANGTVRSVESGDVETYSTHFVPTDWFTPSLRQGANTLTIVARSAQGNESEAERLSITLIPLPDFFIPPGAEINSFGEFEGDNVNARSRSNTLQARASIPQGGVLHKSIGIPCFGDFGLSIGAEAIFNYEIVQGRWNWEVSADDDKLQFLNWEQDIPYYGEASGTVSSSRGFVSDDLVLTAGMSIGGTREILRVGLADLLVPGGTEVAGCGAEMIDWAIGGIPWVDDFDFFERVVRAQSIAVLVKPDLEGEISFGMEPEWRIHEAHLGGLLPLEGAYEANVWGGGINAYVGGESSVEAAWPGDLLKDVRLKAYVEITVSAWALGERRFENVFLDRTFIDGSDAEIMAGAALVDDDGTFVIGAAGNKEARWGILDRSYLEDGKERFLHSTGKPDRRLNMAETSAAADLDVFRRLGNAQPMGAVHVADHGPGRRIESDPDLPAQAELPLLENVFPHASPALAEDGQDLMLLYARDTGAEDTIHFTEIAWTLFDGEEWSQPASLTNGDFGAQVEPRIAFDGQGRAIAVWEQFRDPDYEPDVEQEDFDPRELGAEMEIAWAHWDSAAGEWSSPEVLTANNHLDRSPRLAGPLANGDLLATWVDNPDDRMTGETGAESRVWWARWASDTNQWSEPAILVDGLVYDNSLTLDAAGDRGLLAWSRAFSEDASDPDSEVFYRIYDAGENEWESIVQLTDEPGLANQNVRAKMAGDGPTHLVWQRGNDLVSSQDFALPPEVVREQGADSLGLADFALTLGPGGNLLAIWQDMAEVGSTAHYRVFDPASGTWGEDQYLSQDSDLEKSFAPVWDAMGNLTLAYLNVEILRETKTVEVEGGDIIEIEGVPQPGQNDLLVAKRAIIRDLAVQEGSLEIESPEIFPGEEAILRGTIENSGNVGVSDVEAAFYLGDPEEEGELIEMHVIPGWLRAGETHTIETDWTIPLGHSQIYLVVDPDEKVTLFSRDNSVANLDVGNVDLALNLLRNQPEKDGSLRFVVEVRNVGTDPSAVTSVAVFPEDSFDAPAEPLGSRNVSRLESGESVELAIDLPAGTQPEGERTYRLSVDENGLLGDADSDNHSFATSVFLWIDSNDDGIPNSWYERYELDPEEESFAGVDLDGDGYTVWQEYLMGTSPRDRGDYPRAETSNVVYRPEDDVLETTISWPSAEGRSYRLEYSHDLKNWELFEDRIPAAPPLNSFSVALPGEWRSAFFRVSPE